MNRRSFIWLSALAISPRVTRRVLRRRGGPHPEPRVGITAAKIPASADLTHKSAGRTFDQVRQIPQIVDGIRHQVQAAKAASGDVPRELTEAEYEEIRSFGSE